MILLKIIVLTEDTSNNPNIKSEHGLSLYIETQNHKILFDMGQSRLFADNAEKLGVDLSAVDIAVISHGHYDHGGGLKYFFELNKTAPVYISQYAFGEYYNGTQKYIGLDKDLISENRLIYTAGSLKIDDELSLFVLDDTEKPESFGLNMKYGENFLPDDFRHEQYLMISENGKRILISGCSHKGILRITEFFKPDILIGGFHFVKLEPEKDKEILTYAANILNQNKYTSKFYTCHCTGVSQFEFLRNIIGENLGYISTGQTIFI